jgi:membrane complex biogenesis BtpA family protein
MHKNNTFTNIFSEEKPLLGMIHVQALPGTPRHIYPVKQIIDKAIHEAQLYRESGINGVIIENMHDIPYLNTQVGEEIISVMSVVAAEVKKAFGGPVGVQVLAGANRAALAVALAGGLDFIRAESYVFGHIADEGYMQGQAGELLRYRKNIGAEHIAIFTDIKKKHASHQITSDISLYDTALAAGFFDSDAVIITGMHTGDPVNKEDLQSLKNIPIPILIGSGLNQENLIELFPLADAFIIGTAFKENNYWTNPIDKEKVQIMVSLRKELL